VGAVSNCGVYSKTWAAVSKITNKPNGLCDQENWWCRK